MESKKNLKKKIFNLLLLLSKTHSTPTELYIQKIKISLLDLKERKLQRDF